VLKLELAINGHICIIDSEIIKIGVALMMAMFMAAAAGAVTIMPMCSVTCYEMTGILTI
jgi:hypothetical protein